MALDRRPRWPWAVLAVTLLALAVLIPVTMNRPAPPAFTPPASAGKAAPTLTPQRLLRITVPADPHLLILGDSFTAGTGADQPTHGWAYLVADKLGWDHQIDGVGGTGYTSGRAGQRFGDRIHRLVAQHSYRPNVVIVQGGLNDYAAKPEDLQAAVRDAVTQLRTAFPGVQIVLFGPVRGWIPGIAGTRETAGTIAAAAYQLQVPYVNPYDVGHTWVTPSNTAEFAWTDGAHPSTRGHQMLADWFLADFRRITSSRG